MMPPMPSRPPQSSLRPFPSCSLLEFSIDGAIEDRYRCETPFHAIAGNEFGKHPLKANAVVRPPVVMSGSDFNTSIGLPAVGPKQASAS